MAQVQMIVCNLSSTSTAGVNDAGYYTITGSISLPGIPKGDTANSAVVAVISKNGSPIHTTVAGSSGFLLTNVLCAASDTISVALTSSASVDQGLNKIKCTVAIG